MTTVNIDIESLLNEPMRPWQNTFLNTAMSFKPGEMMTVISASRQTGKSYYNQFMSNYFADLNMPSYEQIDTEMVDSEEWVSVKCNNETAAWVREQKQKYWYEHNTMKFGALFDMHSKLYTMLKLKFTP